jgi:hypothetical protein
MDLGGGHNSKVFSPSSAQVICQTVQSEGKCLVAGSSSTSSSANTGNQEATKKTSSKVLDGDEGKGSGSSGETSQILEKVTQILGQVQKVMTVLSGNRKS